MTRLPHARILFGFLLGFAATALAEPSVTTETRKADNTALEQSIDKGLEWLAKQQQPDGSWRSEEPVDPQTKPAQPRLGPNGSTALAMLAFFAQGYGPGTKTPTEKLMTRAQDYLINSVKQPKPQTASWVETDGGQLSHALALIAIISCYRDNKTEALQDLCQQGLSFTEESIDPKRHGWGRQLGDAPDLEVSYWQMEAVR